MFIFIGGVDFDDLVSADVAGGVEAGRSYSDGAG